VVKSNEADSSKLNEEKTNATNAARKVMRGRVFMGMKLS